MKKKRCKLCGIERATSVNCRCMERSALEDILFSPISEGNVINTIIFGPVIVRGIGFRVPECNEVIDSFFLQLAIFWVEYSDGALGWMDLCLNSESNKNRISVKGWDRFGETIGSLYPGADKEKIEKFVRRVSSNRFRKVFQQKNYGKQIFYKLF